MELQLRGGDYVPDGKGSFVTATGAEETLQRALIRLSARRGCLPWLPELGSRLYLLRAARPQERDMAAMGYVSEALEPEEGLSVRDVTVGEEADGRLTVVVRLSAPGRQATIEVNA